MFFVLLVLMAVLGTCGLLFYLSKTATFTRTDTPAPPPSPPAAPAR